MNDLIYTSQPRMRKGALQPHFVDEGAEELRFGELAQARRSGRGGHPGSVLHMSTGEAGFATLQELKECIL